MATTKTKRGKLTVTLEFDLKKHPDSFGLFCKALLAGGFEEDVKALARQMLAEAKRRKLPIAAELEKRIPA